MSDIEYLRQNLTNQKWRLNHLYHIVNEQGEDVIFKMRPAQEELYDNLHYRNIILKARQEGFTTFIDLLALDNAIFTPNYNAEINCENLGKAAEIFQRKILYPYSLLPREIQDYCPIIGQTKTGTVQFGNGSSIQVDVSARSGTFQFLHISEYGVVSALYPGKAEEILTGSIPAVPKNGLVFIESTAKGSAGIFHDMCVQAAKLTQRQVKLSPLDFKFHFFPWQRHAEYQLPPDHVEITDRQRNYFRMLADEHQIELSDRQMAWYAMQERLFGDKMWSEYPSYPDEAFKIANEGSYYGRQFGDIYRSNRICKVPHDPNLDVYTGWDLGYSDDTAIWFIQLFGREVRVIDYYENTGEGLPHYANILKAKPYRYGGHFAPHDIAVHELGSGASRMDAARNLGIEFTRVLTNRDVLSGIENCREMLSYCYFDAEKTASGIKCLENYRKEFNDKLGCYRDRPLHDWTSHGADAFRTIAVAWRSGMISRTLLPGGGERKKLRVTGGREIF